MSQLRIEGGPGYRISIDGQEVSGVLRSAQLHLDAHGNRVVILEPVIDELAVDADVRVRINDRVAALLIDQGWTPPPDRGD